MHEIVVISGKGGAGKTSITGAFAKLAKDAVLCDLDVDAPDLHLLLQPENTHTEEFRSGNEAVIDQSRCEECGSCQALCRFDAVQQSNGGFAVDPMRCEGCKVCVTFCPARAIDFPEKHCGTWHEADTRFGPMVHARLFPGEENSGRLVTLLKHRARVMAEDKGRTLVLSDGAPGIGCPVISSLAGTDLAVAVTEPTPSGLHDLTRVAELCKGFKIDVAVFINKFDLNSEQTAVIEDFCALKRYPIICRFPHDHAVTEAMVAGRVVNETENNAASELLQTAWDTVLGIIERQSL